MCCNIWQKKYGSFNPKFCGDFFFVSVRFRQGLSFFLRLTLDGLETNLMHPFYPQSVLLLDPQGAAQLRGAGEELKGRTRAKSNLILSNLLIKFNLIFCIFFFSKGQLILFIFTD